MTDKANQPMDMPTDAGESPAHGQANRGADEPGMCAEGAGYAASGIRVKYNGQERDLSPEEAREYAERGMNYEHVRAELELLRKERPLADFVREQARAQGKEPTDYMAAVRGGAAAQNAGGEGAAGNTEVTTEQAAPERDELQAAHDALRQAEQLAARLELQQLWRQRVRTIAPGSVSGDGAPQHPETDAGWAAFIGE